MKKHAVIFRPVAPDDGQALCDVHRAAMLTLGRHAYSQAELESWAYGITLESDLKAMALCVHPDAAGVGLGWRLMQRAEARIASSGMLGPALREARRALPSMKGSVMWLRCLATSPRVEA